MSARDEAALIAGRILGDAHAINVTVDDAFANFARWSPGVRSVPTDTGGRAHADPGDAVLTAAMALSRDEVLAARRDAADMLRDIDRRMQHLRALLASWAATATNPAESADVWCQHCARHGHRHVHGRRRVGGLVVCEWAARWQRDNGTLPDAATVDAHARGKRPGRRVADSRRAPDA